MDIGSVAKPYLEKHGVTPDQLSSGKWMTDGSADHVALAVMDWARDNGASVYTHWFQPLGASGVRHGMSSGVQNSMMEFLSDGTPAWDFKGKNLLFGETDGSSYMNGGIKIMFYSCIPFNLIMKMLHSFNCSATEFNTI